MIKLIDFKSHYCIQFELKNGFNTYIRASEINKYIPILDTHMLCTKTKELNIKIIQAFIQNGKYTLSTSGLVGDKDSILELENYLNGCLIVNKLGDN